MSCLIFQSMLNFILQRANAIPETEILNFHTKTLSHVPHTMPFRLHLFLLVYVKTKIAKKTDFKIHKIRLSGSFLNKIRLSEAVPMRPLFRAKNGGRCRMHHTIGRNLRGKYIFSLFDLTD